MRRPFTDIQVLRAQRPEQLNLGMFACLPGNGKLSFSPSERRRRVEPPLSPKSECRIETALQGHFHTK